MASKGSKQRSRNSKNGNRDVMGLLLVIFSLFFLLCIVIPPILSVVSRAIFNVVLGVFGVMAYPILIALLLWGTFILIRKDFAPTRKSKACVFLLSLFVLLVLQLATTHPFLKQGYSNYIADVYSVKYSAGGVVLGTIAFGAKTVITEIGCYIVFSLAALIVIAVMTDVVSRIRNRKSSTKPAPVKPAARQGFTDDIEAQGVIPVLPTNRLFVGSIERHTPEIRTEVGTSSGLPPREMRRVTDYGPSSIIENDEPKVSRSDAARHTLYGDPVTINEIELQEFYKRTGDDEVKPVKKEPAPSTSDYVDAQPRQSENLAEPYMRVNEDARNNPAKPRRIEHDGPDMDVCFPIDRNYEFNDDNIISTDDVKAQLQADMKRRRQSDIENSNAVQERPQFDFSDIAERRDQSNSSRFEPVDDIFSPPKTTNDTNSGAFNPFGASARAEYEEPREDIIDAFGVRDSLSSTVEQAPSASDDLDGIINADEMRPSSVSGVQRNAVIENDDNIIIDGSAPTISPATPPVRPQTVDSGNNDIIDAVLSQNDNQSNLFASHQTFSVGGLSISDGPAVDMTETHDITSDIIDGGESSGMYVSADGFGEEPKAKTKTSKKNAPLDNQIGFGDVMGEQARESVVVTETSHRKHYDYNAPPIELLKVYNQNNVAPEELQEKADKLKEVCEKNLKTEVVVKEIVPGPSVTQFEIEVADGRVLRQVESISRDIEYELATPGKIRIEAPIPGKRAVGIEVPNAERSTVGLHEMIQSAEFQRAKSPMTFSVGKDISGRAVLCDLAKIPHLLIAGQTGSGKSACLNSLIVSLLYKSSPEDLRFILVDPKRVELAAYRSMPHLLFDGIIYEPNEVLNALKWSCMEMERRYSLMAKYGKNQLAAFNDMPEVRAGKIDKLPHIIVLVDELADIMLSSNDRGDIEDRIKTIAGKARAAGIHLILATQRPSADVITGTIKANLTSRIAFKVKSHIDSNIILGQMGAETLVGTGDMLFHPDTLPVPIRVQGSFISNEEVATVIAYIKDKFETDFDDSAYDFVFSKNSGGSSGNGGGGGGTAKTDDDPLLKSVIAMSIKAGQVSTSSIQRRFSLGFTRAGRIMDIMSERNYVGPSTGNSKPRDVLLTAEKFKEIYGEDVEDY